MLFGFIEEHFSWSSHEINKINPTFFGWLQIEFGWWKYFSFIFLLTHQGIYTIWIIAEVNCLFLISLDFTLKTVCVCNSKHMFFFQTQKNHIYFKRQTKDIFIFLFRFKLILCTVNAHTTYSRHMNSTFWIWIHIKTVIWHRRRCRQTKRIGLFHLHLFYFFSTEITTRDQFHRFTFPSISDESAYHHQSNDSVVDDMDFQQK